MTELSRRRLLVLASAKAALFAASPVAASGHGTVQAVVRRNASSFRAVRWEDHFNSLRHEAIVCDTRSKALHYWSEDGATARVYPCSVPMSEELTRRGRTEIILKRRDPVWIPTPSMRERDPDLPARIEAGPRNPMGTRALNLTWQYYRIHGIDSPAKIGRAASNGCFGLYNHQVEELFDLVSVGTQVVVI